jgi:hypothetical protein
MQNDFVFHEPFESLYQMGDVVTFYSPTMGEVRQYIVKKVYTNFRKSRKVAYKLHVLNQNNEYWGVVLESNLIANK